MVGSTRRMPRTSAPYDSQSRYGTIGTQAPKLDFLQSYNSEDALYSRPKQRPYGTDDGGEITFQKQPRQYTPMTHYKSKSASIRPKKERIYGTYSGGPIRFDDDEESGDDARHCLLQEGKVYTAVLTFTILILFFIDRITFVHKLFIVLGALPLTLPVRHIMEAIRLKNLHREHGRNVLERRQSYEHRQSLPGTLVPIHANFADVFSIHNYITHATDHASIDSYADTYEHWQPRRLWHEALHNYWPHFCRSCVKLGRSCLDLVSQFLYFHLALQLLITVAQALNVYFQDGEDVVGFFPRYRIILTAFQNMFGVVGTATLRTHVQFISHWWWSWISGLTGLFLWQLPKSVVLGAWQSARYVLWTAWSTVVRGVTVSGEQVTKIHMQEHASEVVHNAKELFEEVKDRVIEKVHSRW